MACPLLLKASAAHLTSRQRLGVVAQVVLAELTSAVAEIEQEPISGASMNPARTFGPNPAGTDFTSYWVYVAGPLGGAMLAVGAAWVLRGPGGAAPGPAPPRATSTPRSSAPIRPKAGFRTATRRAAWAIALAFWRNEPTGVLACGPDCLTMLTMSALGH